MSFFPSVVEAADGGGGGVDIGDNNWPGMTIWMAGKVAADRSIVIWSGFISPASSAIPDAAWLYALLASARFEKTLAILRHVLASGKFVFGSLFCMVSVKSSKAGIILFSLTTLPWGGFSQSLVFITCSLENFLSVIVSSTVFISASLERPQIGIMASWYEVMKFS